jgi:hypothetical protein
MKWNASVVYEFSCMYCSYELIKFIKIFKKIYTYSFYLTLSMYKILISNF